jgi:threonine aldolase
VADDDGTISPADVEWVLAAAAHYHPRPGAVCIENTHMPAGGTPWPLDALDVLVRVAGDIPVHMDGARLFNAEVATGVPAARWAAPAATVSCCLSKGLCAPVGSLLAGGEDVIAESRLARKRLGGGMRQAGVLAAPGLVALRDMVCRLVEDHTRAARLAVAVAERWPDCGMDPALVRTNIVTFGHADPDSLLDHLAAHGVLAHAVAPCVVRFVTHHDVDDEGIAHAIDALASAPGGGAP